MHGLWLMFWNQIDLEGKKTYDNTLQCLNVPIDTQMLWKLFIYSIFCEQLDKDKCLYF